jgi:hypothetical protein
MMNDDAEAAPAALAASSPSPWASIRTPGASAGAPWQSNSRLYPRLLGGAWERLHPALQRVHADHTEAHAEGLFQVSRAPGWLIGRIMDAARVPRASDAARVRLSIECRGATERWCRAFEGRPLVTLQSEAPGGILAERIGILEFRFRLAVKNGDLLFRQDELAVCLGSWRLPLPHWLGPQIAAREGAVAEDAVTEGPSSKIPARNGTPGQGASGEAGLTRVEVRVMAPAGGLLFSYRGAVRWSPTQDCDRVPRGTSVG